MVDAILIRDDWGTQNALMIRPATWRRVFKPAYRRIVEARDRGTAVLLISAELDEIMSLSDRIAVMYKGHILATLEASTATREQLGLLMAGVKEGVHV